MIASAVALFVAAACADGGSTAAPTADETVLSSVAPSASVPPPPSPSEPASLTPVRLQLRWTLGAEFAGYVAAVEQGYFEAAGLDVTILEGGPDGNPGPVGSAAGPEFTVSWVPSVLAARATGSSDLVAIAQVFQRSGTLALSFRETEVTTPADFRDQVVGVLPGGDRLEVTAAADAAGLDLAHDARLVDLGVSMGPLLSGDLDVAQATIWDSYAAVLETTNRRTGLPYQPTDFNVINYEDEGTAMLQDAVFARASWLADDENEALATLFLKASFQGWMFCRDHPAECVEYTVTAGETTGAEASAVPSAAPSGAPSPGTRLRAGHEAWAMNEVNPLIWPSPLGIGVMDPAAWQHTVEVCIAAGAIPTAPPSDAYRTDLARAALATLGDLDTTGEAFVKGTVEITPGGG